MTLVYSRYSTSDWPEVWAALKPTFEAGESYPCATDITEDDAKNYWLEKNAHVVVVRNSDSGALVGTYFIRCDQGGLGDHICNCGYVVTPDARGKGYAVDFCLHSQREASELGFIGMKFNLVVVTNEAAIKAWRKAGMEIIGTTPNAFRSQKHGLVDAHIMYKNLT